MSRRAALMLALVVGVVAAGGALLISGAGTATADEVRFQNATTRGPDPFTKPADVKPGTFGGTGDDTVCDREKLIRALASDSQRLSAWAEVVGVAPDVATVSAYIRQLRPVTLTQDTQVTNHSYTEGAAKPFQAILQEGTAVLVDKDGTPVVRCRCGNPLKEPVKLVAEYKCYQCPARYVLPPPCEYYDFDDTQYQSYSDADFRRTYRKSDYRGKCYRLYTKPPPVKKVKKKRPAKPKTDPYADDTAARVKRCETPGELSPEKCKAAADELRAKCRQNIDLPGCEKVCDIELNTPGDLCPPILLPGESEEPTTDEEDQPPALQGDGDESGASNGDGSGGMDSGEPGTAPDAGLGESGEGQDQECLNPDGTYGPCEESDPGAAP